MEPISNISRISEEAEMLDGRMLEIKDFLQDIETMLDDDSKDSLSGFLLKKEKNRITVEDFYKKHETHPELLKNLKDGSKFTISLISTALILLFASSYSKFSSNL